MHFGVLCFAGILCLVALVLFVFADLLLDLFGWFAVWVVGLFCLLSVWVFGCLFALLAMLFTFNWCCGLCFGLGLRVLLF